ncbi:P-loop containing nucleoside triphosphate hydrolase protein [Mycena alexandri]|uniref:P-loop containing nucleoside triphosphate hydrolase protein n=1 Tax=Mycena alexandri TaxID=1745969 RepID=A0AAD6TK27_9AGAR|nr:P-loop containing nucleoside triphosphate hydrolase protein [Mycena alexandri]
MGKRKSLTADDLLRQQEGPQKRLKTFRAASPSSSQGNNSDHSDHSENGQNDSDSSASESENKLAQEDTDDDDESDEEASPLPTSLSKSSGASSDSHSRLTIKPRTDHDPPTRPTPPATFSGLGISAPLQTALTSMSIRAPTEVQAACIPPLLQGRDCIGNAKTGSGKTIAFALPILQKLSVDPYGIFALILTPTRELAFQISEQFAVLGGSVNVRTAVIVGGMDMMSQALELGNRPHIVVATPGRIVDHLRSSGGEWDLSRVKFLVLDEADRLLSPTFAPELSYLFGSLPKDRQTCLFTATLTPSIEALAAAPPRPGKDKPFIHRMSQSVETVDTLKQHYILVPSHVREMYLFHLLCNPPESTVHLRRAPPEPTKSSRKPKPKSNKQKKPTDEDEVPEQPPPTIIFCARPKTAAFLTNLLKTLSIRSTALHSRLTQRERLSSLALFRSFVVPVLISTDVGARGLDIEDVAIVINWDLPDEPEEYTHRVGRTARAGRGGIAISFVTERDEERILKIEERINTRLEEMTLPEARVLEKLNTVATAKRLANMELHDSKFGEREEIRKKKRDKGRAVDQET